MTCPFFIFSPGQPRSLSVFIVHRHLPGTWTRYSHTQEKKEKITVYRISYVYIRIYRVYVRICAGEGRLVTQLMTRWRVGRVLTAHQLYISRERLAAHLQNPENSPLLTITFDTSFLLVCACVKRRIRLLLKLICFFQVQTAHLIKLYISTTMRVETFKDRPMSTVLNCFDI